VKGEVTMNSQAFSALFDGLMVVCTAGGFYFVWHQLKVATGQAHNDHRTSQAATVEHLYCRMNEIHMMFLQYPALRGFFYNNRMPADDDSMELKTRVDIACELMADFFQQVFLEVELLPAGTAEGWRNYMTSVLNNSKVTRDYVERHRPWYPSNFADKLLNPMT
jgi:hypothetical protein